ncbi:ABC-three component system protein [Corynebacterium mustelae]|uniref:ABC-three component system protein n=1 Tax=Corynebacterium mustelae TaxID=571915 RepID=UPI0038B23C05
MVCRVCGVLGSQNFDLPSKRANAIYAVTAYFFDSCDIFEEAPADSIGGEVRHVATN